MLKEKIDFTKTVVLSTVFYILTGKTTLYSEGKIQLLLKLNTKSVLEGNAMFRLFNIFSSSDYKKKLKSDYIALKQMQFITYDGLWCLMENDALLLLEEHGTGG